MFFVGHPLDQKIGESQENGQEKSLRKGARNDRVDRRVYRGKAHCEQGIPDARVAPGDQVDQYENEPVEYGLGQQDGELGQPEDPYEEPQVEPVDGCAEIGAYGIVDLEAVFPVYPF